MKPLRIGTGGATGVYYPIGKSIALGLTQNGQQEGSALNGFIGVAQNSPGSIQNLRGLSAGELELAMVQADIASFANRGEKIFEGSQAKGSLRALASLYAEKFQIVVRKDAGIHNFQDLKGKKISVDELGSGTLEVMRIILDAHGMQESDLQPLYLKPIFTFDKMKSGELSGFVMMAGTPMTAVTKLYETGVTLVPIEPSIALRVYGQFPYLYPGKIATDVYAGVSETSTVEVYALLVVSDQMPEETAYAIVETLFSDETLQLLQNGHPQGKAISLDTALNGISIPLHPGAELFYRQKKVLQ